MTDHFFDMLILSLIFIWLKFCPCFSDKIHLKTKGEAKDKTMLKEDFSIETLNNMLAEMLI